MTYSHDEFLSMSAVEKWAIKNDIEYKAEFLPQQLSRNNAEKEPSINGRVTITRGKQSMSTDYTQGIGHVPGRPQIMRATLDIVSRGKRSAATGVDHKGFRKCPKPHFADVLQSLVMDSEGVDEVDTFEEWADHYGYDTDSRKAEKIYEACRKIARDLRRVLGGKLISEARELTRGL